MKIFNWIFSSFFRTLGRFLFYIAVGLIAMFMLNEKAHALTGGYGTYLTDTIVADDGRFYDITTSGVITDKGYSILDNDGVALAQPSSTLTTKQNGGGMAIVQCGMNLLKDNYYSVSYFTTHEYGTYFHPIYAVTPYKLAIIPAYYSFDGFDFNYEYVNDGVEQVTIPNTSNVINTTSIIFKASKNGSCLAFSLSTNATTTSDSWAYLGYKMESLGTKAPTTEEIKNVLSSNFNDLNNNINNSTNIINSNIDSMKDLQNQTNNKLDDLNGNLTSTESADLGALENSAGWLPAGPVDSILNLPLSLLNNLTTNLNKSCQPVILPIPYVNKDLTLPCVNTLYDDMGISGWVTTIGVIASAFIMFSYLLKLYKWVDDTLSFRENNSIDNWGGI